MSSSAFPDGAWGIVGAAYGSTVGSPKWNANADFNGDGRIDILDIAILARWYGTSS